jgi:hypothetical protein
MSLTNFSCMNLVCATSSLVYLSGIFYVHVLIMGWMVMLGHGHSWCWVYVTCILLVQ